MKYYRVIVDGVRDRSTNYETVINELLTVREREIKFPSLKNCCFEFVDVPRGVTYWSFGARFEDGTGANYDKTGYFMIINHKKVYYK